MAAGGASGKVSLLDQKRATNAGIALSRIKMKAAHVALCLQHLVLAPSSELDASAGGATAPAPLTAAQLTIIAEQLLPTASEAASIRAFVSPDGASATDAAAACARLGDVERFLLEVAGVPQLQQRAAALLLRATFGERVAALATRADAVKHACSQLASSARLSRVLQAVRALATQLTALAQATPGAARRQVALLPARPSLTSLPLLASSKLPADHRRTLLHVLAELLERDDADAAALGEAGELDAVVALAKQVGGMATSAAAEEFTVLALAAECQSLADGLAAMASLVSGLASTARLPTSAPEDTSALPAGDQPVAHFLVAARAALAAASSAVEGARAASSTEFARYESESAATPAAVACAVASFTHALGKARADNARAAAAAAGHAPRASGSGTGGGGAGGPAWQRRATGPLAGSAQGGAGSQGKK
jgi:hypothetical protein